MAPYQDLTFLHKLFVYKNINVTISQVEVHKFLTHLSYLTPESVALSFFNNFLFSDTKKRLTENLINEQIERVKKKIIKYNKRNI